MRRAKLVKIVICAAGLILLDGLFQCPVLRAMPRFMEWYDASPDAKPELKGKCSICHVSNDGTGPLTEFGQKFADNGFKFTSQLRAAFPAMFAGDAGATASAAPAFDAKEFFEKNCAACHGADGKGALGNTPNFTDATWQNGIRDSEMIETIKKGRGMMPSWQETLSADQIQAMVKFVRRFAKK